MKKLLMTVLTLMSAGAIAAIAGEKDEFLPEVKKAVENLDLKIQINTVMPARGGMVNNSDTYILTIRNGSANCDLPFFGESYTSVIYGVDETGIKLDNCPVKVKVDKKKIKKGEYILKFKGRSGNDDWSFIIDVWTGGEVNVSCTCPNKSGMNYIGELVFD